MNDVEWVNDGRTAIINGWYFHFDEMYAMRGTWKVDARNRMELVKKYVDSDEIGGYSRRDLFGYDEVSKRRAAGHTEMDWGGKEIWHAFFLPPEDRFNQVLQDAYQTYLLEKALKSI